MAYAPADDPEIALAIIVENAGHGGEVSAPIARDFFAAYFRPGRRAGNAVSRAEEPSPPVDTGALAHSRGTDAGGGGRTR